MTKKLISLLLSLVVAMSCVSMIGITASAAVEKPTVTVEFSGEYRPVGPLPTYFADVDVYLEVPQELSPYELVPADWVTTFEDSYKGVMIQGFSVDLKVGDITGNYTASQSSINTSTVPGMSASVTDGVLRIVVAYTGDFSEYYAGESRIKLGTFAFRVTDLNAANTISIPAAEVGVYDAASSVKTMYTGYEGTLALPEAIAAPSVNESLQPDDEPKTVAIVNSDVTAVVDADYSETSWQKGQGAMIEFKTADLADFVAMNWVLNLTNGATKYAKVNDFSVAGVATENVQFFATFVVNESEATKADYLEIATVGAGFKKAADETVYEAE